ncbi:MAG: branched-chain amino acid ABC transporter permease [Candidatus Woesearchaeota archaeon]|nr:branched-chain amino acid ABC transporter permease [Candidatus Woesearchaeota archaeon]
MSLLAQLIANGIIAGAIYALVALGYTMVYGILKFINFAHGEILMMGAYFAYTGVHVFALPLWMAAVIAMALAALLGIIIERVAYRPLRFSGKIAPLVTAVAMSLLLQSVALIIWGGDIRTLRTGNVTVGREILGAMVTNHQLVIIVTTAIVLAFLFLFLKYTKMGKAMRAVTDNLSLALTLGINVDRVIMFTFALGSALAALAGVLIGVEQTIQPTMGVALGIAAFSAAVVGGIGNIHGAVLGAFVIGLAENIGIWFIPSGYKPAISFLILIIMLIFKPTGILGESKETDVRKNEA